MPKITKRSRSRNAKPEALSPEQQERLLRTSREATVEPAGHQQATEENRLQSKKVSKRKSKKTHRLTVDFPYDLYEEMRAVTDDTGQTMKGFLVTLVKKHVQEVNT